jgi:anti-sigma regulatory factor (Ser/Thr protein kinase)
MLAGQTTLVTVADESQVGEARRVVTVASHRLGLDETLTGTAAIVVTEAATNIVKHAGRGEILVRAVAGGIEVMALDRGPGIADIAASLRDGYSTTGTRGNGLGAIRRMASSFDIYSAPGLGTAVLARIVAPPALESATAPLDASRLLVSAVSVPKAGETLNGDAWVEQPMERGMRILVVDGLGHGPVANEAAHAAIEAFRSAPGEEPAAAVETCHLAMRSTRGAALAVAEIGLGPRLVRFAGIGNIAGSIWNRSVSHHTVSLNGTAGHGTIRPREFSYPWPDGGLLVLASDGLATRWSLESYPGLASHDPALVAGVLYRDHSRGRDDVTVVVAREARR